MAGSGGLGGGGGLLFELEGIKSMILVCVPRTTSIQKKRSSYLFFLPACLQFVSHRYYLELCGTACPLAFYYSSIIDDI